MRHKTNFLIIIFHIFILSFFIADITLDALENKFGLHFYTELLMTLLLFYVLFYEGYKIKRSLTLTQKKLTILQNDIAIHIGQQFNDWKLSKAETDVAWLIIKGFSFKEIANIRSVSEKTIHQQSSAIYNKSNTQNKHELMSVFLEDFIATRTPSPSVILPKNTI